MPRLSLSLFGAPLMALDGTLITARLPLKAQALLAYLALEADRPQRREALAALFWPDLLEDAGRNNLRQTLHLLRRALNENSSPFLCVTPQTVQFNLAADHWLDTEEFASLIGACEKHEHRRRSTCSVCIQRLRRAAELYRGELLSGVFLSDSIAFEEWAIVKREQFARMALGAWHDLADYYSRRGDYEHMEQAARQQIAIDPFREDAHRQVMQALAWSGHRNDALAHYAAYHKLLEKELGVQPETETIALAEQFQSGALSRPRAVPVLNWPAFAQLTPLIGRDTELAQLAEYLQSPQIRLLTLVGLGGVGKTRLALQAAAQAASSFRDGACFVPLDAALSESIPTAIASALRMTLSGSADTRSQVLHYLRDQELLLVLDNLEHIAAGAAVLITDLLACPRLTLLATSRVPLLIRGEQQFPVLPLATPRLDQLTQKDTTALASYPAVSLFVERARAARPDLRLTAENAPIVAEICAHLDGLPLAIELAAAHSRLLSPRAMLDRLANHSTLPVSLRELPARQRSLHDTMDWSYSLLNEDEKKLLARLSVFRGGCTLDAIEAICCDDPNGSASTVLALVESLCSQSLLQLQDQTESVSRFTLLETIREYAAERLNQNGDTKAICARHYAHFTALAERAAADMTGPQQAMWLERLEVEHDNLRAALRWALQDQEAESALRLGGAMWRFWYWRGHLGEGRRWLAEALALADSKLNMTGSDDPDRIATQIRALIGAGMLASAQDDYDQAFFLMETSLELQRKIQDKTNLAPTLVWLGSLAYDHGDYERAAAFYSDGLKLCRELGPAGKRPLAFALNRLGEMARHQGDDAAALSYHEEGLLLWRELGSKDGIACALHNLGYLAHRRGEDRQAAEYLREGLALAWELKDKRGIAEAMTGLALVAGEQGQMVRAVQLFGQIESILASLGSPLDLPDRGEFETSITALRGRLGEAAFQAAWASGQAMLLDQAVAAQLA